MIEIRGLSKRFGRLVVLRDLDLEIAPGRVTAIVGPNAAGKTTLIRTILGLTRPNGGMVRVAGEPVNGDPSYRALIGYMAQIARFPDNLTGRELLAMLADLRTTPGTSAPAPSGSWPSHATQQRDDELLQAFGLERELDKPLRTLSGGTRQKVNAVMAFLFDPPILILDEPTAGLDPVATGILKDKIRRARDAGKTFILTSHIMSELEELADDVVFLVEGQVRFAGPVDTLKARTRQFSLERAVARLMTDAEAA
ncbi:MAG TPA: ABC transporter ATP-binding protein [Gemmatimonadaceae bacterium]